MGLEGARSVGVCLPSFQDLWAAIPRNPPHQSRAGHWACHWAPWLVAATVMDLAMLCLSVFLVSVILPLMLRVHATMIRTVAAPTVEYDFRSS